MTDILHKATYILTRLVINFDVARAKTGIFGDD